MKKKDLKISLIYEIYSEGSTKKIINYSFLLCYSGAKLIVERN